MTNKEEIEKALKQMSSLPVKHRWIVYWYLVTSMTFDEIGKVLGLTRQGVKHHYDNALERMILGPEKTERQLQDEEFESL